MKDYKTLYYLSHPLLGEKEVTKEEFIKAERAAGFFPKSGKSDDCATGGFGVYNGLSGKLRFVETNEPE